MVGPIVVEKLCPADMERPMATPAWLSKQNGKYLRTDSLAFVIYEPNVAPMLLPAVRKTTYKTANMPTKAVTFHIFSFAPTNTKNKT